MALRMRFVPPPPRVFQNQHGAVLYGVLMVLLLLTIIGVASTKVSNTEVQISTNELIYQQNFYRAEGAAMEAAELLEASPDPSEATAATWLDKVAHGVTDGKIRTWAIWGIPHTQGLCCAHGYKSHRALGRNCQRLFSGCGRPPKFMATPSMATVRHSAGERRPSR